MMTQHDDERPGGAAPGGHTAAGAIPDFGAADGRHDGGADPGHRPGGAAPGGGLCAAAVGMPAGDGEPLKAELPRETRLRIRVLGGSFKMLAAQLRDFGPALTALVGL